MELSPYESLFDRLNRVILDFSKTFKEIRRLLLYGKGTPKYAKVSIKDRHRDLKPYQACSYTPSKPKHLPCQKRVY